MWGGEDPGRVLNPSHRRNSQKPTASFCRLLAPVWDRAKGSAVILGLPESPACPQQSY